MKHHYILLISGCIAIILSTIFSVFSLGGYNQAEVSALLSTSFTPAGYTFAIWSIIYTSWIVLGIAVATQYITLSQKNIYLLASAQILSSLWLIPSQFFYIGTSFIVIVSVLYLLLLGFFISWNENIYFRWSLELFLAWIIIASIANFHLMLVDVSLYIFPVTFSLISLLGVSIIFLVSFYKYNTIVASLVFLWSAIGIIIGQENNFIQIGASFGALLMLLFLGYNYFPLIKKYILIEK